MLSGHGHANATPVTRLRFIPVFEQRRRAAVAHKPRRRQLADLAGHELEGNVSCPPPLQPAARVLLPFACGARAQPASWLRLAADCPWLELCLAQFHTLGYFSADVCVGTPSKSFDLIVDTGSALTAFPCADCTHCGAHEHASSPGSRFSVTASSTSEQVQCSHPPRGAHCRSCSGGACGYSVSYTEGSSIRGKLVYDVFHFGHSSGARTVRASFGCQTYESGLFYSQVADGISGFSQANSYGPTLFDYLRTATGAPDVFSMCLSEEIGAMVLGGSVPPSLSLEWIPYTGYSSYNIDLRDIRIGGTSIGNFASNYRSTIVDSGTTFMYLPPAAYRKVRDYFRTHCSWGDCAPRVVQGEYSDDYCFRMSVAELDSLTPMSLHMSNGVEVNFGPRQYAYELRQGVWCLSVLNNEHNGAVIGAVNMRNHEVIFDRAHRRLAFAPSDCGAMHHGEHPSLLQGGYSLNGCAEGVRHAGERTHPPPPVPAPWPTLPVSRAHGAIMVCSSPGVPKAGQSNAHFGNLFHQPLIAPSTAVEWELNGAVAIPVAVHDEYDAHLAIYLEHPLCVAFALPITPGMPPTLELGLRILTPGTYATVDKVLWS